MLSHQQIILLNIARREVTKLSNGHFTEETYRSLLRIAGKVRDDAQGRVSSKDLTNEGFDRVMAALEEMGFRDRMAGRGETYWRDREGMSRLVHEINRLGALQRYRIAGLCRQFSNNRTERPEKLTSVEAVKLVEMLKSAVRREVCNG